MAENLLVTGSRGTSHVTSAQAANYHSGIVGDGQYVMSGMTATMTSSNICHIDPGVASMNGRDVEVPAGGVDVTISNGTQAQQRHDLVCLRYTAAGSDAAESVELVCVEGTPDASSPQDPSYNDGSVLDGDSPVDMPLYRVALDGVSVSEPEALFETVPSIAELWNAKPKQLWSGSATTGSMITVEGITDYNLIAVKYEDNCTCFLIIDGDGSYSSEGLIPDSSYGVGVDYISISISGNSVQVNQSGILQFTSTGLGAALIFTAGDNRSFSSIWGIA